MGAASWILAAVFAGAAALLFSATSKTYPVPNLHGAVLITGASSGIGRHAALELDRLGFTVFAGVRKEADGVSLTNERSTLVPLLIDVADAASVASALQTVSRELAQRKAGTTDENLQLVGLVNNAGISRRLPIELENVDKVKGMYEVNVFGLMRVTQAFIPLLRASSGRIINIGSVAGLVPHPGGGTYCGTKAAVESMTDILRMELMAWNISVSIVEPAYVKTKIASKQLGENSPLKNVSAEGIELYRAWADNAPRKRAANELKADSPVVTSEAIVHALTSSTPKTRYAVANVGGLPASLVALLAWALPDRILDQVIMAF